VKKAKLLDELVRETGTLDKVEIIRSALNLYHEALRVIPKQHPAIIIRDGNNFIVK